LRDIEPTYATMAMGIDSGGKLARDVIGENLNMSLGRTGVDSDAVK